MSEYRHPLLRSDGFELVAITDEPGFDRAAVPDAGYAIATARGALLHRDLGLDEARAMLARLVADARCAAIPPRHAVRKPR